MESSNHRMRFVSTTFLAKIGQSALLTKDETRILSWSGRPHPAPVECRLAERKSLGGRLRAIADQFEVHAGNYIGAGGAPHAQHGVCASNDQREVWLKSARLGNRLVATSASIRIA